MAKIFYNGNRIIVDGHAETAEECKAITAMCDSMANDENFKTIVYEEGHAVFEQVSGGDSMMFAMVNYMLVSDYEYQTGYNAAELAAKGTIKARLDDLEALLYNISAEVGQYLKVSAVYSDGTVKALEAVSPAEYKLPYTAAEIEAKLANL